MKSHTHYLWFDTAKHRQYINITREVAEQVKASGIKEGFCLVSAMHITASVFVNDNESGLLQDIDDWLEEMAPYKQDYRHHATGESNGDSHLKNLLMHHQVVLPITKGKLDLGPWQAIFYGEFDGQRRKRAVIKILGE
ncbi:secondary thiamine-phosphate synthase enzyme [Candidatus Woesearchaeota archaeon CG1_02_57_44]|nr:MAG: secondary thiamine-phosphate synthase enzyme [Candidatus Woesearchaeota archaeon CG1_02_57_44]PIN69843.1 MAG: secondary thiamine-phosphate synthase enzyme [Candidatus Woesearchaeota archaeon CG11_big_fil_rev_8_21_14_0_20_57_5]